MSKSYEVGYGKPPKHTQFKKGQSGNPVGGKKTAVSLGAVIKAALNQRVTVSEHGQMRTISKLEAIVIQAVNQAAGGDLPNARFIVDLARYASLDEETSAAPDTATQEDRRTSDQALLKGLRDRLAAAPNEEPSDA